MAPGKLVLTNETLALPSISEESLVVVEEQGAVLTTQEDENQTLVQTNIESEVLAEAELADEKGTIMDPSKEAFGVPAITNEKQSLVEVLGDLAEAARTETGEKPKVEKEQLDESEPQSEEGKDG